MASAEGVILSGIRKDRTNRAGNSGESRKGAEGAKRENAESLRQKDGEQFFVRNARFLPLCSFDILRSGIFATSFFVFWRASGRSIQKIINHQKG